MGHFPGAMGPFQRWCHECDAMVAPMGVSTSRCRDNMWIRPRVQVWLNAAVHGYFRAINRVCKLDTESRSPKGFGSIRPKGQWNEISVPCGDDLVQSRTRFSWYRINVI